MKVPPTFKGKALGTRLLPTGFGKSLVYELIAPFADFMDFGFRPTEANSIVLLVSPVNALIRDQVTKLRECGLKACILKVIVWL